MNKQLVVDFLPTGEVNSMHVDTFDLGFLGNKSVQRATEIKFDEDTQLWGLYLPLEGQLPGDTQAFYPVVEAQGFPTYEVAREAEVLWLNVCRSKGEEPSGAYGKGVIARIKSAMASGVDLCLDDWE